MERKRETLAGTENLRSENDKTEFLDVVWNRREAWRQGYFVSKVGISRAVLREGKKKIVCVMRKTLVCPALNINSAYYESRLYGSIRLSFDRISLSSHCFLQQIYLFPVLATISSSKNSRHVPKAPSSN